eukprot:1304391-Pleurochrysis_carterae.AAC.2
MRMRWLTKSDALGMQWRCGGDGVKMDGDTRKCSGGGQRSAKTTYGCRLRVVRVAVLNTSIRTVAHMRTRMRLHLASHLSIAPYVRTRFRPPSPAVSSLPLSPHRASTSSRSKCTITPVYPSLTLFKVRWHPNSSGFLPLSYLPTHLPAPSLPPAYLHLSRPSLQIPPQPFKPPCSPPNSLKFPSDLL